MTLTSITDLNGFAAAYGSELADMVLDGEPVELVERMAIRVRKLAEARRQYFEGKLDFPVTL